MNPMIDEVMQLKKEKNAVILAHYYVPDEVQAVADDIGDSFYLSRAAVKSDADVILFAGVSFMGESAKILNPEKTVLLPDADADCPMAHMAEESVIRKMRETYEDLAVVCYINSTAKLKTLSDVCVTSANAVKIVKKLPNQHIFFIPDRNLGSYVAQQVPEKEIILNDGYCPVHNDMTADLARSAKAARPGIKLLVHPECTADVLAEADFIGSTSEIIRYATESPEKEFLIGTEDGVLYKLREKNPDKRFYTLYDGQVCQDMKKVTLEKVRDSLRYGTAPVEVSEEIRAQAWIPLARMLELAK